jgi:signal transduction histidine kinase
VTLAAALWPLLFSNVIDAEGASLGERLTMGTYPCWDIAFVVLGARIALSRPLQTRRTLVLLAALALVFLGDLSWLDSYDVGDWEDYAWLASYVGVGAATLLPLPAGSKQAEELSGVRRFSILALPVTVVPSVVVIETLLGHTFTVVDALLMFVLLLLVLMRLGVVIRGLEEARAELREQNRLKDELISVVSHDLRTPLTSIMGYLELVADEEDPETARTFLDVVRRNTARLHRLVEDLLFVSRVQAGREALELEPVCLGGVVRDTVAASRPAAAAAEVELTCVVETDDVVLVDAHRMAEVLENLLSNALKFTPPGGRIGVVARREHGVLAISVADTGVGIAEEDRQHLFDRFFRASGTDGIPGAGLGLSIVKAIVDAHGGAVAVRSAVGAGTTFEVRLPLHVAEAVEPVAA